MANELETQNPETQDSEIQKQLALAPPSPAPRSNLDYALAVDKSRPQSVRPAPNAEPGSFAWHLSNALGDAYKNPTTAPLVNQPGGATKNLFLASTQALGSWQAAQGNADQTKPTTPSIQAGCAITGV